VRFCRSFCPSEFSVSTARRRPLPSGVVLSWNSLLVQSVLPVEVSCLWVTRARFVVGLCLSCTVFLRRGPLIVVQCDRLHPLFEFCVPPESCSVHPSRLASAGQLLSWAFVPYSTFRVRRSTCCEFAALTSFRLQGLATLLTVCSLRPLAGSVSHRQRSWDFPFGVLPSVGLFGCFHPSCPTYRFSCRCSRHSGRGSPAGRGSWASSGGSSFQRTRI
jgi:hypothetical protein